MPLIVRPSEPRSVANQRKLIFNICVTHELRCVLDWIAHRAFSRGCRLGDVGVRVRARGTNQQTMQGGHAYLKLATLHGGRTYIRKVSEAAGRKNDGLLNVLPVDIESRCVDDGPAVANGVFRPYLVVPQRIRLIRGRRSAKSKRRKIRRTLARRNGLVPAPRSKPLISEHVHEGIGRELVADLQLWVEAGFRVP